jgi:hypothetical protein
LTKILKKLLQSYIHHIEFILIHYYLSIEYKETTEDNKILIQYLTTREKKLPAKIWRHEEELVAKQLLAQLDIVASALVSKKPSDEDIAPQKTIYDT